MADRREMDLDLVDGPDSSVSLAAAEDAVMVHGDVQGAGAEDQRDREDEEVEEEEDEDEEVEEDEDEEDEDEELCSARVVGRVMELVSSTTSLVNSVQAFLAVSLVINLACAMAILVVVRP